MNKWISLSNGDSDAYVLLLGDPTIRYQNDLDGHERSRFCTQIEKFAVEATPESALESEQKFQTPLRQLKDRGAKIRALGTWCNGDGFDLFVVQVVFLKDDESKVYAKESQFASHGRGYQERFESMHHSDIEQKVVEWQQRDDLLIFGEDDF